jgi:hypothetical protein
MLVTVIFIAANGGGRVSMELWLLVGTLSISQSEYGAMVEWSWLGKTEELREKPVPVPLCPS